MSDFNDFERTDTPESLTSELLTLSDQAWLEAKEPTLGFNSKIKLTNLKETLGINAKVETTDFNNLKSGADPFGAVSLSSGRKAFQELTGDAITVSGWHTIAFLPTTPGGSANAKFTIAHGVDTVNISVGIHNGSGSKTHLNTLIKIDGQSYQSVGAYIQGVRIAKSDSVSSAGAKLQVYLTNSFGLKPTVQMYGNTGSIVWQLVTPYLDNSPTLPDGVTSGTFLEAGEEWDFSTSANAFYIELTIGRHASDDDLRASFTMKETPKQGTGLSLSLPATSLILYKVDSSTFYTFDGTETYSNITFAGNTVQFKINKTNIAAGLANNTILFAKAIGSGGKFTIT